VDFSRERRSEFYGVALETAKWDCNDDGLDFVEETRGGSQRYGFRLFVVDGEGYYFRVEFDEVFREGRTGNVLDYRIVR
jgi:hypothetical protein